MTSLLNALRSLLNVPSKPSKHKTPGLVVSVLMDDLRRRALYADQVGRDYVQITQAEYLILVEFAHHVDLVGMAFGKRVDIVESFE